MSHHNPFREFRNSEIPSLGSFSSCPHTPLLNSASSSSSAAAPVSQPKHRRRPSTVILLLMLGMLGVALLVVVAVRNGNVPNEVVAKPSDYDGTRWSEKMRSVARGVAEGVSAKSFWPLLQAGPAYPWTAKLLAWQTTAFHFQPIKNWMNG